MTADERNWKLYEASSEYTGRLRDAITAVNDFSDKWLMTLVAGSFWLSFAFIEKLVPLNNALYKPLLIAAWVCFAAVLMIELIAVDISALRHDLAIRKEARHLLEQYEGKSDYKECNYKAIGAFFDVNRVIGAFAIVIFIAGLLCLIMFVANNIAGIESGLPVVVISAALINQ